MRGFDKETQEFNFLHLFQWCQINDLICEITLYQLPWVTIEVFDPTNYSNTPSFRYGEKRVGCASDFLNTLKEKWDAWGKSKMLVDPINSIKPTL